DLQLVAIQAMRSLVEVEKIRLAFREAEGIPLLLRIEANEDSELSQCANQVLGYFSSVDISAAENALSKNAASPAVGPKSDYRGNLGEAFHSKELSLTYLSEDQIKLGRSIGRGGFGTVYEGTYKFQKVAVKCCEGATMTQRALKAIQQEVQ